MQLCSLLAHDNKSLIFVNEVILFMFNTKKNILSIIIIGLMATQIYAKLPAPSVDVADLPKKQSEQTGTQVDYTHSNQSELKKQYEEKAARWNITSQEWLKFEEIKKGPRGYWSPELDPLTTLGIEAETDAERQHYAEIQAKMEFERAEKELAYQRAYTAAFKRLYPNRLPIENLGSNAAKFSASTANTKQRLALFIKQSCLACDKQVKDLQKGNLAVDIYMIDSHNDDNAIRKWATNIGINPKLVMSKQITLNHGAKLWQTVAGKTDQVPVIYQEINGKLIKQ